MSQSEGELWSREWWLSVVLIGVVVHLLASYLKPRLDHTASRLALWWATRTEKKRTGREARIDELRSSSEKRILASVAELRCRMRSSQSVFFSVVFLAMAFIVKNMNTPLAFPVSIALMALFFIGWWSGFSDLLRAVRLKTEVAEALESPEESRQSDKQDNAQP
jgi:hypothetical protein